MKSQRSPFWMVLTPLLLLLLISLVACGSDEPDEPTATAAADSGEPATSTAEPAADPGQTDAEPAETPVAAGDPPAPTATATPEPTPTPEQITVFRADGAETTMPPLPPAGYLELLERQVEAGEWTEAEGIIQLLRVLAGEVEREQLGPNTGVISESATGLVRHAHEVAQDPDTDPDDRAEIERLLNSLTPSQEALDFYSEPENGPQSGPDTGNPQAARLSRVQAQGGSCADLVGDGFPT
ncbi:MAG TPA: hypothetical protein VK879_18855, partial [Candidatus Sulfomarinibacteraceae bacterium]|nr:hypothetical protein [Candidatus Sulfomarinibacteraceae bacterium]